MFNIETLHTQDDMPLNKIIFNQNYEKKEKIKKNNSNYQFKNILKFQTARDRGNKIK